jgi:2-polyprenyl-3-methyl-5-hydroxy-6-metoxy-1,4-benzoquinol methylase
VTSPLEVYQLQFQRPSYARNRVTPDHDYVLARLPSEGTLLDVGTGAGNFVRKVMAQQRQIQISTCDLQRFHPYDLPFFAVDLTNPDDLEVLAARSEPLITCVGVLEHLPEVRVMGAIDALARACTGTAYITTANHSDVGAGGHELHLTQQPLEWWRDLLALRFEVTEAVPYMGGRGLCFTCRAA